MALDILLKDHGFSTYTATDESVGLQIVRSSRPEIVLVSYSLPDLDFKTFSQKITAFDPHIQILILVDSNEVQQLRSTSLYKDNILIITPFENDVVLDQIAHALEEEEPSSPRRVVADLVLDIPSHMAYRGKKKIHLSTQEFKLLNYLMTYPGRALTRNMILKHLWMSYVDLETRIVDVYIGYLRKKIDTGFDQKLIRSVRGIGYKIEE